MTNRIKSLSGLRPGTPLHQVVRGIFFADLPDGDKLRIGENNRIIVIGNNGSGKSCLSRELSALTGLPLIHLDVEFWRPNWEKTPEQQWIKKQRGFVEKEKWIIDGNHCSTMEPRFIAADLVIFLDFDRFFCIFSVLKRLGDKRSDMPQYLDEKLDPDFLRFCVRILSFPKTGKVTIMGLHKKYPDKPFLVIKSRSMLNKMLIQWRSE